MAGADPYAATETQNNLDLERLECTVYEHVNWWLFVEHLMFLEQAQLVPLAKFWICERIKLALTSSFTISYLENLSKLLIRVRRRVPENIFPIIQAHWFSSVAMEMKVHSCLLWSRDYSIFGRDGRRAADHELYNLKKHIQLRSNAE